MQRIAALPSHAKPRERLLHGGVEALDSQGLLAVILGTGSAGCDVLQSSKLVHERLVQGDCSVLELQEISGIGLSKALRVTAALHLGGSLSGQRDAVAVLNDPVRIVAQMEDLLERPQEHLVAFYLTVHKTQIRREIISIGTVSASIVHPREVFRPAILQNAAHIVLAHTHPSGNSNPSTADLRATRALAEAGCSLGIELLDHVVCAKASHTSLRASFPELFVGSQSAFC